MKEELKKGDRIKLNHMPDDPLPVPDGATGTVLGVNKTTWGVQYYMEWDPPNDDRSLIMLDTDEWELIGAA